MFKNYLVTSFRHLLKNKSTSFINIAGLTLGITFMLVIIVVVQYELSYDSFHTNAQNIYRITRVSTIDGTPEFRTGVVYPLTDALRNELASIVDIVSMQYEGEIQITMAREDGQLDEMFQQNGFVFLEPSFFNIFDYKSKDFRWIAGNPESALREPNSIVLTQELADKYFPDGNILGKTIRIENQVNFKVTGIISNLPDNTDFPFKIIASYSTLKGFMNELSWYGVTDANQAYVIVKDGTSKDKIDAQIAAIHSSNVDERTADFRKYLLQPLNEVHSDSRFGNYNGRTVSSSTIWTLTLVGFFLLIMACINFINLTTAQSMIRGKEVGIRKVLGGNKSQLIIHFLGETFIITTIATILAVIFADNIILSFQDLLGVKLGHPFVEEPFILVLLILIIFFVTLFAGFYPALLQSDFSPVNALKSKLGNKSIKGIQLRRGLVAFQLVISQVFIICTLIVVKQMDYFMNADLGFDKEAVITLNIADNNPEKQQILKNKWESVAGIKAVSWSFSLPSGTGRNTSFQEIRTQGMGTESEGIGFEHQAIDENYLELYKVALLAGRNFVPADSTRGIILNLQLSRRLGFVQPHDALGKQVFIGDDSYNVIGVTEDFHSLSLKDPIDHIAFFYNPRRFYNASIKLAYLTGKDSFLENLPQVISEIEKGFKSTYPEFVFSYDFLDKRIESFYAEETRLSKLFKILAVLSIFIGCLGLYGLVSFMAVRRGKEIGIRKVLGASIGSIITLFSKEFILLVLFAFAVAAPLSLYIMQKWLQEFVFRIDLEFEIFLLAGFASLLIAAVTAGYQSIKASLANPVDSLKSE